MRKWNFCPQNNEPLTATEKETEYETDNLLFCIDNYDTDFMQ